MRSNESFTAIMSDQTFELLMKYLHLNASTKVPERCSNNYDKLYKIRPLLDVILGAFKKAYTPEKKIICG